MSRRNLSKQIQRLSQEAEALELRKQGLPRDVIGQRLGVTGRTVDNLVTRALNRIIERPAEEVRKLELERLDVMQAGLWEAATHGAYLTVDRVLGIMQRRAALMGLDSQPANALAAARVSIESEGPVTFTVEMGVATNGNG